MVFRSFAAPCLAVVMVLLSGCQGTATRPGSADMLQRGMLIETEGQYWFESCLGEERVPVSRLPDVIRQAHARQSLGDDWPVYIEAFGQRGDGALMLSQGLLVGGGTQACNFGLNGIELRAVSEDENTIFDVTQNQIRVRFANSFMQLAFARPEVERLGGLRRWQQSMQASGQSQEYRLVLEVSPVACSGLRGEWHGLSMEARLNGRSFSGCARLGDVENWPLRQRYRTPDSVTTRRIELAMTANGEVVWREDYLNDQPLLEFEGIWQRRSTDRIRVVLKNGLQDDSSVLEFNIAQDGSLRLRGFHPAYGRNLAFEPAAPLLRMDSGELDWWR